MYIYNLQIKSKNIFKIIFIILFIIMMVLIGISIYKVFINKRVDVKDTVKTEKITQLTSSNYTSILKEVHNNLNAYVGKKIKFTGFVYRLYDFSDDQIVIAREMIVSSNYQAVVVGFLCHLNEASKYQSGSWVEIEGTITKGEYHGEIPVIEINKINSTTVPSDEYVYPPDNSYVQTNNQL